MNFNDLIEEILKNYNYDIDIETLKSYYRLLYCDIKYFFNGRSYEIIFKEKLTRRKYGIDMCSFLSLMEIQNEMLEMGLDIHYSLYNLTSMSNDNFNELYLDFSNKSDVYKLGAEKNLEIQKLKNINNLAEKLLLEYFENK